MSTFNQLGLDNVLVAALKGMAIRTPTLVQSACIPPLLQGRDCIGSAQTGSGKTMAFALPILQSLLQDPYGIYAVVLTPTRELAFQIHDQFKALGRGINLGSCVIVGGLDMMVQAQELAKRPHVIIATPGRLVDLMSNNQGQWDLARAKFLVLDEADRLLAPSFSKQLQTIIEAMPASRQTLLFTATVTDPILALRDKKQADGKLPPFVHLSEDLISIPQKLKQNYIFTSSQVRDCYLFYLLRHLPSLTGARPLPKRAKTSSRKRIRSETQHRVEEIRDTDDVEELPQTIIFVSRCKSAAHLSLVLADLGIDNAPLHSHLTQKQRLASLAAFRACSAPILVATDVGSRGLDIPEVQVVINWDLPREPDDYVHRVGRTARAGRGGTAISIVTEGDVDLVTAIESRTESKMEELQLPEDNVLESLNKVSTAQRVATIQMRSDKVGERHEINKAKAGESKSRKRKKVDG